MNGYPDWLINSTPSIQPSPESTSFLKLPAHFDDVTDEMSRRMNPNLIKMLQELPESPTRNIEAN